MRIADVDVTPEQSIVSDADTEWSPRLRPEVLAGPEQRRQQQEIAAALFGGAEEAVKYGRYRLLDRLGEGGMGVVYAAYDEHLERKIALKLIRTSRLDSIQARERTLREARALARLSHPNVVHVYEVGELEGQLFVAMEFLAGVTLRTWQTDAKRSWRDTLRLFCQAGEGLAAAHAESIVHRDFKPHNAMLGADGRVRVLDFGLARFGEAEEVGATAGSVPDGAVDARLTLTGTVLGTPAYMAPEQFAGLAASERSDQYSFCVALFEALYGERPFREQTIAALVEAQQTGRVTPRPRDTAVPQRIHAVLLRGLQVDPASRWPSMTALLAALVREPGVRLRQTAAAVALLAFTGAGSYALARPDVAAAPICPDAGAEIAETWDATRAAAIREGMRARHGAPGDEVLAIVEPMIDRYATEWAAMRNEACMAHAEGRQSAHVFDLRTACLDQRRAGLDAVIEVLETTSETSLRSVAKATSGLPPLTRCADTQALLAALPPPEDPALQARVQAHRETLARAQVHEDVGQYVVGLAAMKPVFADEQALAHEPLLAEAYLTRGSIEMYTDPAEGVRSLERALWAALATGHARVAAQASSKRGFLHAVQLSQIDRAQADLPMIAALNRRVADDIELYAEYLNNVGGIHKMSGDWREARRWLEEARDLRVAHTHPVNWRSMATLENLARLSWDEKRYAEAMALYRDVMANPTVFGPKNVQTINREGCFAGVLFEAGRPREALALLRPLLESVYARENLDARRSVLALLAKMEIETGNLRAARAYTDAAQAFGKPSLAYRQAITAQLMVLAARDGDEAAMERHRGELTTLVAGTNPGACRHCYVLARGAALEAVGRTREALAIYEQMRTEIGDSTLQGEVTLRAQSTLALGKAHFKLGELEAAERELLRALGEFRALYPVPGPDHGQILHELGELMRTLGRRDEARTYLREAESSYAATAEPDYVPLAATRFAYARALTDAAAPASAEARGLAEAALQAFTANDKRTEAHAVEAWLAEHAPPGPRPR
jgi:tRNA A-37 threonylcarbamoyl transferase component Bud32/tetratricopeptide (TPR) repeat protein